MSHPDPNIAMLEPLLHTLRPWLSRPNVVGLSAGTKRVAGTDTGQPAVVVHVVEKKPTAALGPDEIVVPERISMDRLAGDGRVETISVATDVIQVGVDQCDVFDQRVRPVPGGYQIAAKGIEGTGTLGVNIVWGGRFRSLTNNHVISENGHLGADVFQPDGSGNNKIGIVDGYVPVVTYPRNDEPHPAYNSQDLAYANVTEEIGDRAIELLGTPKGLRAPKVGETIRLVGKQTAQLKTSKVRSITLLKKLEWLPGQWAWFDRMIELEDRVTQPGDSGSAYVARDDDMVVGLHVASNAAYSWGCQLWPF